MPVDPQIIAAAASAVNQAYATEREQVTYRTPKGVTTTPREFHGEEAVPGVVLHSYATRTPDEDGKYVVVVEHSERIEKIKQPPTTEEIAEAKAEKKRERRIILGVVGTLIGAAALVSWIDSRRPKPEVKPVPTAPAKLKAVPDTKSKAS